MNEGTVDKYWAKADFCCFRAEAAKNPVSQHIWIQLAQDWIALAENVAPDSDPKIETRPSEGLDPFLVA
jgi:hypothetical protein